MHIERHFKQTTEQTQQAHQRRDVFLIHGWMMNRLCWREFVAQFKDRYRLTTVDLPGHGDSLSCGYSFARSEQLLDGLLEAAPANAVWVGWSLGGLLAQLANRQTAACIDAIVSITMGARYVAGRHGDWPYGVNRVLFRAVRQLFSIAPEQAVRQLVERQTLGSEHQQHTRAILGSLASMPWDRSELKAGLELLNTADARDTVQRSDTPILFVGGERDLVVNCKSLKQSSQLSAHGAYCEILGAGHAPFLSHRRECHRIISDFINARK